MDRILSLMMQCIKSVINKERLDSGLFDSITEDELKKLFTLSKKHDVAHLVSYTIAENEISLADKEISKILKKQHPIAVLRYESTNQTFGLICDLFEKNKIPFIPLKGVTIREHYPAPWMRTSCDLDVLVHENDMSKAIELLTCKGGYEKEKIGTHDVSLFSPNGTHVELHHMLAEVYYDNEAGKMLDNVWKYAHKKEGFEYQYSLSDEFYYFYHIYHTAKHFECGGCGIRPFVDLFILDNKVSYDRKRREELLESGGLLKFARHCQDLSDFWFSNGKENEVLIKMQDYIVKGGVYGTSNNKKALKKAKNNKFEYIFGRVFLSYDKLKIQYPAIKKHEWLTPIYQVRRWFKLFVPKHLKKAKESMDFVLMEETPELYAVSVFLKQLGLK